MMWNDVYQVVSVGMVAVPVRYVDGDVRLVLRSLTYDYTRELSLWSLRYGAVDWCACCVHGSRQDEACVLCLRDRGE